ncbi:hypothetical protein [Magnetospirillum molischianum]|uniref:Uncharacterized protein n=1 Tax=Magnetospirillum molischianum DSM 120 TaxID=1150626 RepID=H8FXZ9_MAGML|nr:hypothetical protein [Magnetospirillum molischianum]CCG43237.1 hypothetical protein PHAMO_80028 [Magnetospirillum molischianum DSM 120]
MADKIACQKCGRKWHPHLIDAKDDGTGNFTILEGPCCYGPNWVPTTYTPIGDFTRSMLDEGMKMHEIRMRELQP